MTWAQFCAARQQITEERLGAPIRRAQREEAAKAEELRDNIRRVERMERGA